MRSSPVVLCLFLLATALMSVAVMPLAASPGPWRWGAFGLAVAQTMLAAGAVVLMRQWFGLRLVLLAAAILAWPLALKTTERADVMMALLGAALFAAAWCGALRLIGWRLCGCEDDSCEESAGENRGQFSLATVMLAITTAAVYLGWLRSPALAAEQSIITAGVAVALALPVCLLLTCLANRPLAWTLAGGAAGIYFAVLYAALASGNLNTLAEGIAVALAVALAQAGAAVGMLLAIGFRLRAAVHAGSSPLQCSARMLPFPSQNASSGTFHVIGSEEGVSS